jgi:hypothetical protein
MTGRTLEIRTLWLSTVRTSAGHTPQAVDLMTRGHFADCPFRLSVSGGGGHSPPLGAVRPLSVRRREEIKAETGTWAGQKLPAGGLRRPASNAANEGTR